MAYVFLDQCLRCMVPQAYPRRWRNYIIHKKPEDHILHDCEYAKEMMEILNVSEYDKMGLAVGVDLFEMEAHYHKTFDEIFYVLEGNMDCMFYDPD